MDKQNEAWLDGDSNFYFRYKRKVLERSIEGSCLNVGCGSHIILGAINIDENATNLPYPNDSFGTVILSDVIEHIKNWEKAVDEAIRVARIKVIITVPAYMVLWSDYDKLLGHYRRYNRGIIDKFLKNYPNINYKVSYLFGIMTPLLWFRKFTTGETPKVPQIIDNIFYALSYIKLPFGSTLWLEIKKKNAI